MGILRDFFREELKVELVKSSEKQAFPKPQGKIHSVILVNSPRSTQHTKQTTPYCRINPFALVALGALCSKKPRNESSTSQSRASLSCDVGQQLQMGSDYKTMVPVRQSLIHLANL